MISQKEIKVFQIFGVEIFINLSWFWILLLAIWTFTMLSQDMLPQRTLWFHIFVGFFQSILFFSSVLAHELGHALVAIKNKIPVKKIILFIFGGVSNIEKEPGSPKAELVMSLVGPVASFLIGAVFFGIGIIMSPTTFSNYSYIFILLGQINIFLGIFNLLPGFPLDGGRVFRALIWSSTNDLFLATRYAAIGGKIIAGLMIFLGIMEVLLFGSISGLWLAFIGFFLFQSAKTAYNQLIIQKTLEKFNISNLINLNVRTVLDSDDVSNLVDMPTFKNRHTLVTDRVGRIVGIIYLPIDTKITQNITAKEIMTPISKIKKLSPVDTASAALFLMFETGLSALPVFQGEEFIGIISMDDLSYFAFSKSPK